jgi:hypothetical protein
VELFEIITTMKTDQDARYSVVELCWALGVSRSGFYDHEQKPDCERRREDGLLAQKISVLFLEGRCTYLASHPKGASARRDCLWKKADRSADEMGSYLSTIPNSGAESLGR